MVSIPGRAAATNRCQTSALRHGRCAYQKAAQLQYEPHPGKEQQAGDICKRTSKRIWQM